LEKHPSHPLAIPSKVIRKYQLSKNEAVETMMQITKLAVFKVYSLPFLSISSIVKKQLRVFMIRNRVLP